MAGRPPDGEKTGFRGDALGSQRRSTATSRPSNFGTTFWDTSANIWTPTLAPFSSGMDTAHTVGFRPMAFLLKRGFQPTLNAAPGCLDRLRPRAARFSSATGPRATSRSVRRSERGSLDTWSFRLRTWTDRQTP